MLRLVSLHDQQDQRARQAFFGGQGTINVPSLVSRTGKAFGLRQLSTDALIYRCVRRPVFWRAVVPRSSFAWTGFSLGRIQPAVMASLCAARPIYRRVDSRSTSFGAINTFLGLGRRFAPICSISNSAAFAVQFASCPDQWWLAALPEHPNSERCRLLPRQCPAEFSSLLP